MTHDLNLPEEALLLALDDDSGRQKGSYVSLLMAGAALAEFALEGRVRPKGEGKKMRLELVDRTPPAHPFLRRVLDAMTAKKGFDRAPKDLISRAASTRRFLDPLREELVGKGILERRKTKILGIFPSTVYPLKDTGAEEAVKARLRAVMFHGHQPTPRDSVLIALTKHAGLLRRNFDKAQLKEHKTRINELAEGSGIAADATKQAIEAVQAAVMAAVIAGTVATT